VAMEDPAFSGQALAEDLQHVGPRVPVVNDHREVELLCELQLADKQLHLRITVSKLPIIIETDFPNCNNTLQARAILDPGIPVITGLNHRRRRDPDAVVDLFFRLQILIELREIDKVISDGIEVLYP